MPADEIRTLAADWTEKAMHKQCDTSHVCVWTKDGEVVIAWDWEEGKVALALKTECEELMNNE